MYPIRQTAINNESFKLMDESFTDLTTKKNLRDIFIVMPVLIFTILNASEIIGNELTVLLLIVVILLLIINNAVLTKDIRKIYYSD